MVGLHGGYIADKPVVIMTKKGESWGSENAIRLDCVRDVHVQTVAISSADNNESYRRLDNEFRRRFHDCSGVVVWYDKSIFNDETKALVLGFKNANCMYRHIRRMKRKKEQERRRRLKQGVT